MVYLVGAGPGDPGLITLKGKRCLERAEVVIYDFLANPELLALAPEGAELIYVGKKGADHTMAQEEITRLVVEKGRDKRVVRLKGGDPFIFGRGGEEAQALADAGVDFEVVPGVTSAIAVPAYAGIPLTHRDFTPTVAFITGHERAEKEETTIAWDKLATAAGTLVFLMGRKNLKENMARLIEHGLSQNTPAAAIRWGTTARQESILATVGTIADAADEAGLKPPVIVVTGEVASLRRELNWFEKRPLFGKRILVTRAREQASALSRELSDLGAQCLEFPTIKIVPPEDFGPLDRAVGELSSYEWLIFTSVNGVRFFRARLFAAGLDARALAGVKVAAIGPATAEALVSLGINPELVPGEFKAEDLVEALSREDLSGKRILIPRAEEARMILPEELEKLGAKVDVLTAYRTTIPEADPAELRELLAEGKVDAVTFTASSTVKNLVSILGEKEAPSLLEKSFVACIGPITEETAKSFGIRVDAVPGEYTIEGLVAAVASLFRKPV